METKDPRELLRLYSEKEKLSPERIEEFLTLGTGSKDKEMANTFRKLLGEHRMKRAKEGISDQYMVGPNKTEVIKNEFDDYKNVDKQVGQKMDSTISGDEFQKKIEAKKAALKAQRASALEGVSEARKDYDKLNRAKKTAMRAGKEFGEEAAGKIAKAARKIGKLGGALAGPAMAAYSALSSGDVAAAGDQFMEDYVGSVGKGSDVVNPNTQGFRDDANSATDSMIESRKQALRNLRRR